MPWVYSFIIRKRQQVDSFNDMPKEKRPPERLIWHGTSDDLEKWIETVYPSKGKMKEDGINIVIKDDEIG
jgi:hypothetical protein